MLKDEGLVVFTNSYTVTADKPRIPKLTIAYHHVRLGHYVKLHLEISIDEFRRMMLKAYGDGEPFLDLTKVKPYGQ